MIYFDSCEKANGGGSGQRGVRECDGDGGQGVEIAELPSARKVA